MAAGHHRQQPLEQLCTAGTQLPPLERKQQPHQEAHEHQALAHRDAAAVAAAPPLPPCRRWQRALLLLLHGGDAGRRRPAWRGGPHPAQTDGEEAGWQAERPAKKEGHHAKPKRLAVGSTVTLIGAEHFDQCRRIGRAQWHHAAVDTEGESATSSGEEIYSAAYRTRSHCQMMAAPPRGRPRRHAAVGVDRRARGDAARPAVVAAVGALGASVRARVGAVTRVVRTRAARADVAAARLTRGASAVRTPSVATSTARTPDRQAAQPCLLQDLVCARVCMDYPPKKWPESPRNTV